MIKLTKRALPAGSSLAWSIAGALVPLLLSCEGNPRQDQDRSQPAGRDSATAAIHRRQVPLTVLPDPHAICRLDKSDPVPAWAAARTAGISSISRTGDELSIIVVDSLAPRNIQCNRGWRAIKIRGPIPLNLIGVVAGLYTTLANATVSVFALSTFDTDYVMVEHRSLDRAVGALRRAGYQFIDPVPEDSVAPLPVKPVDEGVTDPEFFLFRARVQTALAAHDTAEIMRIVDPDILNSFGGNGGREEFRQRWDLKHPEKSELWVTLGSVLALGGRFHEDSMFLAPYPAGGTSGDGFQTLVVLGANVPVHAAPVATSKVIDTLSFEEVTQWREKSSTENWEPIRTSRGQSGWVLQRHLRSPIDYRAGFVRREGRWWMRALVAGD